MALDGRGRPGVVAAAVLVVLGVCVYANSLSVPFIWDDEVTIVDNPGIRRLWPVGAALFSAPRHGLNARPTTSLSLALNHAVAGLDVRGYHAVNLALHVCSALVLFGIVRRTFAAPHLARRFGEAASPLALAVAAIWLVHPLQTETVTYLSQRPGLLAGLFLLLTLYAARRAWDSPHPARWYALSIAFCALALTSKEEAVSAPLLVILYDRVFVCSSYREALVRRRALYAGLVATWLAPLLLLTLSPYDVVGLGRGMTPWEYATTQLGIIVRYLRLALWPDALCLDYGSWVARSLGDILPPAVVVGSLLGATAVALARARPVGYLGAWFFLILAPTSSIVPIPLEVMAERRMYLPLAAVVVLAVSLGFVGGAELARRWPVAARLRRAVGTGAVVAVVGALAALTVRRNHDYRSELAIWTDTVRKRPANARAHAELGTVLLRQGDAAGAITRYEEALRLEPERTELHLNLGAALLAEGRLDDAIARYRDALRIDPGGAAAQFNLATALLARGEVDEAFALYAAYVRVAPDPAAAHEDVATALLELGRLDDAVAHYAAALALVPGSAHLRERLGAAEARRAAHTTPPL